jgi:hypothetical protein
VIEIDELALIEFFGVSPEPRSKEEREFFAAPLFIKRFAGIDLEFSISGHLRDLRLVLRQEGSNAPLLELVVPDVFTVRIDRNTPRPWLRVSSETRGVTLIAVEPAIRVICDGSIAA